MRFGLQKMTLLDYPGKVSCTVFTCGCNYRCPFCHNGSLVQAQEDEQLMDEKELLGFLKSRTGLLEGVCITGGEPLLQKEIFDFLVEVRSLDFPVKLDTNGSFPDKLRFAVENGLVNYVAMDIKNTPEKYLHTIGSDNPVFLEKVQESVDFLIRGDLPFEFRTTVVKGFHEIEDFEKIGRWIKGAPRYFLQKFTDSGDVLGDASQMGAFSDGDMRKCLDRVMPFIPNAALRGIE